MDFRERHHDGWSLRETGPTDADHTALLLAGGMCPASFYDDLLAQPHVRDASLRLVAATLPGHAGTPPPRDVSLESYARLGGLLARDLGCDVLVGHSLGANVAIEMACSGEFEGPMVLLSPSFSREDEAKFLRVVDRIGNVVGALPYRAMLAMAGQMVKDVKVSDERRAELGEGVKSNDPGFVRRAIRAYFEYLDARGSVAGPLCESGVPAWVAFGDHGDVGLRDDERAVLEDCPHVTLVQVTDAGHMTLNEQPTQVAAIVLEAVASART